MNSDFAVNWIIILNLRCDESEKLMDECKLTAVGREPGRLSVCFSRYRAKISRISVQPSLVLVLVFP